MIWHCIRTRPGTEFAIRDALIEDGACCVVPTMWQWRKTRLSPPKPHCVPMFSGYIFAGFPFPPDWYALATNHKGWMGPLRINNEPARLASATVEAAEMLLQPLSAMSMPGRRLTPGEKVRIRRGKMAEIKATILGIDSHGARVMTSLFGGRAVTVPLDMIGGDY